MVDAIEGTRSLGEAARAIVNDLASSLLRLGINTFLSGAFGGFFQDYRENLQMVVQHPQGVVI